MRQFPRLGLHSLPPLFDATLRCGLPVVTYFCSCSLAVLYISVIRVCCCCPLSSSPSLRLVVSCRFLVLCPLVSKFPLPCCSRRVLNVPILSLYLVSLFKHQYYFVASLPLAVLVPLTQTRLHNGANVSFALPMVLMLSQIVGSVRRLRRRYNRKKREF